MKRDTKVIRRRGEREGRGRGEGEEDIHTPTVLIDLCLLHTSTYCLHPHPNILTVTVTLSPSPSHPHSNTLLFHDHSVSHSTISPILPALISSPESHPLITAVTTPPPPCYMPKTYPGIGEIQKILQGLLPCLLLVTDNGREVAVLHQFLKELRPRDAHSIIKDFNCIH